MKDSAKVDDPMVLVAAFGMCSVNPVDNVQSSVGSHEKDIIPRQVFHLAISLQNNELW